MVIGSPYSHHPTDLESNWYSGVCVYYQIDELEEQIDRYIGP